MSYDLYFWPTGSTDNPAQLAEHLADGEADALRPDDRVLAFRAELLRRWPELADMVSPWHQDLDWRRPWGRTDLADRFVGLTLPYGWEHVADLPALAAGHGLDCYDPQFDEMLHDDPQPHAKTQSVGARAEVRGWVAEDNVVELMRHISQQIGYAYDELDETALVGALENTNDELPDAWFQYPLGGTRTLKVHLAQSPGSAVVSVRVEGQMNEVLAARIETMLELL